MSRAPDVPQQFRNLGPTANAAMNFLGNVDALIIDLRENGGGDPKMVAYISSYLFDERTHLNDLYNRKENKTEEFWTSNDVPGKRFAGKPVFVLTRGSRKLTWTLTGGAFWPESRRHWRSGAGM